MERAIEQTKDLPVQVEIEYRPYKIYPSLQDGQFVDKRSWYESRFGSERIAQMESMAVQRAKELGISMCVPSLHLAQLPMRHRRSLSAYSPRLFDMHSSFQDRITQALTFCPSLQ